MQGRVWLAAAAALVTLCVAAPAQAGQYRVWTCRLPDGRPAPIRDASSGWTPALRPGTAFTPLEDRCASGAGIYARLSGPRAWAEGGQWTFVPPPGTSLGGYSVTWSGNVTGGGEATLARSDKLDPDYPDRNGQPFGSKTVAESGFDIASITTLVACSFVQPGEQCPGDPVAEFTISRAVMTLNDLSAPQASDVSGSLVSSPTLRGPVSVSFAGKDSGGGLYRVVVQEDGKDVGAVGVPDSSGRCVGVDSGDVYAFKWPQPCPLDVRTSVTIDAEALPEGQHVIGVFLEDAAGNRAVLAAPAVRTVVHRGAFNGGDGAVLKRVGHYTVVTSFARRKPTLRGTLTRAGAPVAGALLDVLAKTRTPGATFRKIAEVRTGPRGGYKIKVPAGPSRLLRVAYKAYLGDEAYASYASVNHRVKARVDFRALTKHIGLRGTARFAGAVRGGFVPRRGKLIELQAYDHGRWRTFATLRTKRNGRFRAHYSFSKVAVARSYRFRARARYEPSYPFMLGVSKSAKVRVG